MPVWKNQPLTQVFTEAQQLTASAPGQLILYGEFRDIDTDFIYTLERNIGLRISEVLPADDPPAIWLELEGSPLKWSVLPTDASKIEWVPADEQKAHDAVALPRSQWPIDIRDTVERIEQGAAASLRTEARTRLELIDPVLDKKGWTRDRIRRDVSFQFDPERKSEKFLADYILYADHPRRSQASVAIIEAKRESLPPDYGVEQGKMYADILSENVRFVFATNGREFVQHDRTQRTSTPPQPMSKFPTFEVLREVIRKIPENEWRIDKDAYTLNRFVAETKIDGDDANTIETIAKLLVANEALRQASFEFFLEALLFVNEIGRGKWATTVSASGQFIRLHAGKIEVMAIFRNGIHLVLDETRLTEQQRFDIGRYAQLSHGGAYRSVKSSIACDFRADALDTVKPMILDAQQALLSRTANSVPDKTSYSRNHSAGVLDYLRKVTRRKVPNPVYS